MEERLNAGKSKGGRPVKKIKREKIIMVRLSKSDHFIIEGKANKAGIKISDWFRQAAKAGKVSPRISPEDLKVFRMLAGMANNLNLGVPLKVATGFHPSWPPFSAYIVH